MANHQNITISSVQCSLNPKRFYHIILNNRSRNKHPCQIDHVLEQNWTSDFTGQEAILL